MNIRACRYCSVFLIIYLLVLYSCEKESDYRNKYLGNWRFDVTTGREWYAANRGFFDTSFLQIYHGKIECGGDEKAIVFQSDGYSREFLIDRQGRLIPEQIYGPNYSESGSFESRSTFKYYYYHHWGGSRQYIRIFINGERE